MVVSWFKANALGMIMFVIAMYVSLQTLEVKFDYQEQRAAERYRLLVNIANKAEMMNEKLISVEVGYKTLDERLARVEEYIPSRIVDIEKSVLQLSNSVAMVEYKAEQGS